MKKKRKLPPQNIFNPFAWAEFIKAWKRGDFKSNQKFWQTKIERNIERDKEVNEKLAEDGWKVLRFWGKEITQNLDQCIVKIKNTINETERNTDN